MRPLQSEPVASQPREGAGQQVHALDRGDVAAAHDMESAAPVLRAGAEIPCAKVGGPHFAGVFGAGLPEQAGAVRRAGKDRVEIFEQVGAHRQVPERVFGGVQVVAVGAAHGARLPGPAGFAQAHRGGGGVVEPVAVKHDPVAPRETGARENGGRRLGNGPSLCGKVGEKQAPQRRVCDRRALRGTVGLLRRGQRGPEGREGDAPADAAGVNRVGLDVAGHRPGRHGRPGDRGRNQNHPVEFPRDDGQLVFDEFFPDAVGVALGQHHKTVAHVFPAPFLMP